MSVTNFTAWFLHVGWREGDVLLQQFLLFHYLLLSC